MSSVALYARVSSESQARDNTIASQIMALRERIAADGFQLEPDHSYVDDGYSGTILLRPALERLRDAIAGGHVERIYVHAPDRLARRYAHQVLLIDEFRRAGTEVVFLNHPIGGSAEDDLLLQVQGVIAEYERAKILERSRRGRRHAAQSGSVSALTGAPYGYRYVSRGQGDGEARFEVVESEVHIVRLIFAWIGLDRMSLRAVCRRLQQMGCQTRRGSTYWHASTIRGMVNNPAYIGRAAFGRARFLPPRPRLRPIRGHQKPSPRASSRVSMPREEWIEIPVPAIVDPAVFEAAKTQLEENRQRKRERGRGHCWLLQGLAVCQCCGYAYYGKTAPRSRKYDPLNILRYYRCTGADGYRFSGQAICNNHPVRGDELEQLVWDQVRALLEDPCRVAEEYRRRIGQAHDGAAMPEEMVRLNRQLTNLRRGIGRLIDSYAEGIIDKTEFEPRLASLKQRLSQLQERHQAALAATETERELALVVSRLEDFAAKVTKGLDQLDRTGMRDIIRTMVRRIEIDQNHVEVIFRVPPSNASPNPTSPTQTTGPWQHCTGRDHPAPWQKLEAFGGIAAPDNFDRPTSEFGKGTFELVSGVAAISKNMAQPGIGFSDRGQNGNRAVAVLNVGGMHMQSDQMARSVGDDVALAPIDLLAGVVAARAAAIRGFHRLTVDHAGRRTGLAARPFTREHHQRLVDLEPSAVLGPGIEVTPHRRDRRKILGQRALRIAAGRQIQDRVDHFAQICRSWPAKPPSFGKKRLRERPFAIGHVACVAKPISSILRTGDLSLSHRKLHRIVADRWNNNILKLFNFFKSCS